MEASPVRRVKGLRFDSRLGGRGRGGRLSVGRRMVERFLLGGGRGGGVLLEPWGRGNGGGAMREGPWGGAMGRGHNVANRYSMLGRPLICSDLIADSHNT